jgi:hypothetical protein
LVEEWKLKERKRKERKRVKSEGLLLLFGWRESRVETEWEERSIFINWQKYPYLENTDYSIRNKKKTVYIFQWKNKCGSGCWAIVCHKEVNRKKVSGEYFFKKILAKTTPYIWVKKQTKVRALLIFQ